MIDENPHSKYSQYILDNYFTISFRVGIRLALYYSGLWELYPKKEEKKDKRKVGSSKKKDNESSPESKA